MSGVISAITRFEDEYRFLSNFYPYPVTVDGVTYPTLEHAYQSRKTLDTAWQRHIREATTPGAAKRLGREAPLREDWDRAKMEVMLRLLRVKFSVPPLAARLLGTGDAHLEEGNNWEDRYWGTVNGEGHNQLGKFLMLVRDELRQQYSEKWRRAILNQGRELTDWERGFATHFPVRPSLKQFRRLEQIYADQVPG